MEPTCAKCLLSASHPSYPVRPAITWVAGTTLCEEHAVFEMNRKRRRANNLKAEVALGTFGRDDRAGYRDGA